MEPRQAKALHIAATTALVPHDDGRWHVPSQSGNGTYTVAVGADLAWSCTCPDFEERLAPCKHVLAVEVTIKREAKVGGVTYSETVKVTYRQDWPNYNKAQCNEKRDFMRLLSALCATIPEPEQTMGRPRLPLSAQVFAIVFKVYVGFSARRFTTDLEMAKDAGLIEVAPAFNSTLKAMRNADLEALLEELVTMSSLPLTGIERDFAVDSTGFGAKRMRTWYSTKHGKEMQTRDWRKLHAMCGVKTNVITAAQVGAANTGDAPYLPDLAKTTAKHFELSEVSADKGYLSMNNAAEVEALGAVPLIPFKSNTVKPEPGTAWARMWHYSEFRHDDFLDAYHKRSNVESTFGMIKAKFGDELFSTSDQGMSNEVLCKCVAHNLCCLVSAFYELGIDTDFAAVA